MASKNVSVYDGGAVQLYDTDIRNAFAFVKNSAGNIVVQTASSGGSLLLGGTGVVTNLRFAENSSITGGGSKVISLGQSGDTFNINVSGVTYNLGTVSGNPTFSGNVTIQGILTVGGTATINSTTLTVADKNIELAYTISPSDALADGGGITLRGTTDKTIIWDNTNDNWTLNQNVNVPTGFSYKINNVSLLSATALGSSIVSSSLTSVGTITSGVWNGTNISPAKIATDSSNRFITDTERTNWGSAYSHSASTHVGLTGANASGTWGIDISGASDYIKSGIISDLNTSWLDLGSSVPNGLQVFRYNTPSNNQPMALDNANWLINIYSHGTGGTASYGHQITGINNSSIFFRVVDNGSFGAWLTFIHSGNYNSYAPTLTGVGASGSWNINATNITAYTINQNLGTTNSPTFSALNLSGSSPTSGQALHAGRTIQIQGTTNQININNSAAMDLTANRSWTLSLPQNIHTAASPTFAGLTINGNVTITGSLNGGSTCFKERVILANYLNAGTAQTIPNSKTYTIGSGKLMVFVNGDLQDLGDDYTEFSTSSIKFTYNLPINAKIIFYNLL